MAFGSPMKLELAYQDLVQQRELTKNLKAIEELGARVIYQAVDVVESQVRSALDELEASIGKVSAIVHGAELADKFVDDMSEGFHQGLEYNSLAEYNRPKAARFEVSGDAFVLNGRYGRKGQLAMR